MFATVLELKVGTGHEIRDYFQYEHFARFGKRAYAMQQYDL